METSFQTIFRFFIPDSRVWKKKQKPKILRTMREKSFINKTANTLIFKHVTLSTVRVPYLHIPDAHSSIHTSCTELGALVTSSIQHWDLAEIFGVTFPHMRANKWDGRKIKKLKIKLCLTEKMMKLQHQEWSYTCKVPISGFKFRSCWGYSNCMYPAVNVTSLRQLVLLSTLKTCSVYYLMLFLWRVFRSLSVLWVSEARRSRFWKRSLALIPFWAACLGTSSFPPNVRLPLALSYTNSTG